MTPRSAASRGPGTPAWLDSTGSLIVRVSRPGIYEIADDGTVQRLDSAGVTAAVPLEHGDHVPAWKWCYFGLTIGKAEAQGVPGHRFCEGCARLSADEEDETT